jgi:hypothetical protein
MAVVVVWWDDAAALMLMKEVVARGWWIRAVAQVLGWAGPLTGCEIVDHGRMRSR